MRSLILLAVLPATAHAAFPIGRFSDNLEKNTTMQGVFQDCYDRWDGGATVCSNPGSLHVTSSWQFQCLAVPADPTQGMIASVSGPVEYAFHDRVHRFGAFFTSNSPALTTYRVEAWDENDNLLFDDTRPYAGCGVWQWTGIESPDVRIARVRVTDQGPFNGFVQMTNLMISGCDSADADGDGVCDRKDICPGHPDGRDGDHDDIPDACDGDIVHTWYDVVGVGAGTWAYDLFTAQVDPGAQDLAGVVIGDHGPLCPTAAAFDQDDVVLDGPAPTPWTSVGVSGGTHLGPLFEDPAAVRELRNVAESFRWTFLDAAHIPWGTEFRWTASLGVPALTCRPILPMDPDDDRIPSWTDNCDTIRNVDQLDRDGDGRGDPCDACPGSDDLADMDADGRPDDCDNCPDDPGNDPDQDRICAAVDLCFGDNATGDSDLDGVCDDRDACVGDDALGDPDGDGICGGCLDADSDGVCDPDDVCLGDDATGDSDGDGTCDDIDPCAGDDSLGDPDGDGICGDDGEEEPGPAEEEPDADSDGEPDRDDTDPDGPGTGDCVDEDGDGTCGDQDCVEGDASISGPCDDPGDLDEGRPTISIEGCGCQTTGAPSWAWLGLLALLRRRR